MLGRSAMEGVVGVGGLISQSSPWSLAIGWLLFDSWAKLCLISMFY